MPIDPGPGAGTRRRRPAAVVSRSTHARGERERHRPGNTPLVGTIPSVAVPADPHAPARARAWLEAVRPVMSTERMEDLRLAVSELVANSVQHAGLRPGHPIRLSGRVTESSVMVTVADGGPGFTFDPGARREPTAAGGRGLLVVTAISERLLIDAEAGRVTVEVHRR
jgi:anti-sigma regulatory factor (Ser/Thr protein kinase)